MVPHPIEEERPRSSRPPRFRSPSPRSTMACRRSAIASTSRPDTGCCPRSSRRWAFAARRSASSTARRSLEVDGRTVRLEEVSVPKPGQSVAFVMDTRPCEGALALARDVDLLVIESTYLHEDAQMAHDHAHMTAVQAATIGRDAGARRVVLTHFSQRYRSSEPFLAEASAIPPGRRRGRRRSARPRARPPRLLRGVVCTRGCGVESFRGCCR